MWNLFKKTRILRKKPPVVIPFVCRKCKKVFNLRSEDIGDDKKVMAINGYCQDCFEKEITKLEEIWKNEEKSHKKA